MNYETHCEKHVPCIKCAVLAREEAIRECCDVVLPKVQKFIDKVESGAARSKETYTDMLAIRLALTDKLAHLDK